MSPLIPEIMKWQRVFLDTSVIIDLMKKPEDWTEPKSRERVTKVHNLFKSIDHICKTKKRTIYFYISSVTVGELFRLANKNTQRAISNVLRSENLEVIDYSFDVAKNLVDNIKSFLPSNSLKEYEKLVIPTLRGDSAVCGRRWLLDDYKIAFCAKTIEQLDVVITGDERSFTQFCVQMGLPVFTTNPDNFPVDVFGNIDVTIQFNGTRAKKILPLKSKVPKTRVTSN